MHQPKHSDQPILDPDQEPSASSRDSHILGASQQLAGAAPNETTMSPPIENICSCIVYARPGSGDEVAARVRALPGAEVHAGADLDKLVVTIEDTPGSLAADIIGGLNDVPGVINTVLIYHYGGDDIAPDAVSGKEPLK
jgi:nitrate reductase NapD